MANEAQSQDAGGIQADGVSFLGNKIDKLRVGKGAVTPFVFLIAMVVVGWLAIRTFDAHADADDARYTSFGARIGVLETQYNDREKKLSEQLTKNDELIERVCKRLKC